MLISPTRVRGDDMIFTIQSPDKSSLRAGLFEAMKLGLEFQEFADNTFETTVHSQIKLDRLLEKSRGKVVGAKEWGYEQA